MPRQTGLRERKKVEQRQRLADVAAELFAERGYDHVSINDVAAAAGVSYQTVYNYFPAKQDLGLDRAEAFRKRYGRVVRERPAGVSPAVALQPLVREDIDRYRGSEPGAGRGEHPALCVGSATFRGFALLARERDAQTVAEAMLDTCPALNPLVARVHATALIAVCQAITDRVGSNVLLGMISDVEAAAMERDAQAAFGELDRQYHAMGPATG